MSKALDAYLKTIEMIKQFENELYNHICKMIDNEINCGHFKMWIKDFKEIALKDGKRFNFVDKNIVNVCERLKEDGFIIHMDYRYQPTICWDNPAAKEYMIGGAKYNEAKKALED